MRQAHKLFDWERGTGYVSGGIVPYAAFPRDTGIDTGYGYSVTMPPLMPVSAAVFYALVQIPTGPDMPDEPFETLFGMGGITGVEDQDRHVISELALDLTFVQTFHNDTTFGGQLEYESWLLGVRLGGPARYVPSYTLTAGWGWHKFEFESRPHARVEGQATLVDELLGQCHGRHAPVIE